MEDTNVFLRSSVQMLGMSRFWKDSTVSNSVPWKAKILRLPKWICCNEFKGIRSFPLNLNSSISMLVTSLLKITEILSEQRCEDINSSSWIEGSDRKSYDMKESNEEELLLSQSISQSASQLSKTYYPCQVFKVNFFRIFGDIA